MTYCYYQNRLYSATFPPIADSEELSAKTARLMLRHTIKGPIIFWTEKDIPASGWVIGIEKAN
jgi:hypothetical protein